LPDVPVPLEVPVCAPGSCEPPVEDGVEVSVPPEVGGLVVVDGGLEGLLGDGVGEVVGGVVGRVVDGVGLLVPVPVGLVGEVVGLVLDGLVDVVPGTVTRVPFGAGGTSRMWVGIAVGPAGSLGPSGRVDGAGLNGVTRPLSTDVVGAGGRLPEACSPAVGVLVECCAVLRLAIAVGELSMCWWTALETAAATSATAASAEITSDGCGAPRRPYGAVHFCTIHHPACSHRPSRPHRHPARWT
jgi:hypothetical protein